MDYGPSQFGVRSATLGVELNYADPNRRPEDSRLDDSAISLDSLKLQLGFVTGYSGGTGLEYTRISPFFGLSWGFTQSLEHHYQKKR